MTEKTTGQHDSTIKGPGFAAFIDLHDSTYAWDQNADTAAEMIRELYGSVETAADQHGGHVGNFTGDGFLLLFASVENSILCLSRIIQDWEKIRGKYIEKYSATGIAVPDEHFLALRTGISFGNFGPLAIKNTVHYSGSGINKAQRCEAASKDYFSNAAIGALKFPNYVFLDSSAENLIQVRSDFLVSGQLSAQFKGYFQPAPAAEKPEFETRKQFIYAVWPKEKAGSAGASAAELEKLALAQTKSDIGDRLMLAAQAVKSGRMLHELSESAMGTNRKKLLEETVKAYRDALAAYTAEVSPEEYGRINNSLGSALNDQAFTLTGEEKRRNFEEAAAAHRRALRVYSAVSAPKDYAIAQNGLGHVFRHQADLLAGEEKKRKLSEALTAFSEALRMWSLASEPSLYSKARSDLGNILYDQAEFLAGEEKKRKLSEAVASYKEALKTMTADSAPEYYALTQTNLGVALKEQAGLTAGREKEQKLSEAVAAYKETLRVHTFDAAPSDYALTQNRIGNAFGDQAELLAWHRRIGSPERTFLVHGEELAMKAFAGLLAGSRVDMPALNQAFEL